MKRLLRSITVFCTSLGLSFAARRLAISAGILAEGRLATGFAVGDGTKETNAA